MGDNAVALIEHLASAAGGFMAAIYLAWRRFKKDSNDDSVDTKSQGLINSLQTQLEAANGVIAAERQNSDHLRGVIDRLAKERNDAVKTIGKMEGRMEVMSEKVSMLTEHVDKMDKQNVELTNQVRQLMERNNELMQMVQDHNK